MFCLYVKTLAGVTFPLHFPLSSASTLTITKIKYIIQQRLGFPVRGQKLVFKGKSVDDTHTLKQLGVRHKDFMVLLFHGKKRKRSSNNKYSQYALKRKASKRIMRASDAQYRRDCLTKSDTETKTHVSVPPKKFSFPNNKTHSVRVVTMPMFVCFIRLQRLSNPLCVGNNLCWCLRCVCVCVCVYQLVHILKDVLARLRENKVFDVDSEKLAQLKIMGFHQTASTRALLLNRYECFVCCFVCVLPPPKRSSHVRCIHIRNDIELAIGWLVDRAHDIYICRPISEQEKKRLCNKTMKKEVCVCVFISIN